MRRHVAPYLVIAWVLLGVGSAFAHEIEVLYNRTDPITVVVKYKQVAKVRFWEVVLDVSTTLPKTALEIKKDKNFPNTITLANIAKKTRGMIYVTTTSGTVVHMEVQHWGKPAQVVNVKDARTEAERAVERASRESGMSPEERAVRQLWNAQGDFPTDGTVQIEAINHRYEPELDRQVTLTKRYETVGFYGFTQKVQNLTDRAIPLHPSTIDVNCPLFSVELYQHVPALRPGDNPHEIAPRGSVLVHLTCKGGRSATLH